VLLASLAACAGLSATPAFAGDQVEAQPAENAQIRYLIKLLGSSAQFRVRAQAAIALGLIEDSHAARSALQAALQDPHPAVRAAAATSLGRIGDPNHVYSLRTLATDPDEPVRNAARASIGRIESNPQPRLTIIESDAWFFAAGEERL
jgi:HEAT repeat protein